jgi:hypothetical protein
MLPATLQKFLLTKFKGKKATTNALYAMLLKHETFNVVMSGTLIRLLVDKVK